MLPVSILVRRMSPEQRNFIVEELEGPWPALVLLAIIFFTSLLSSIHQP